MLEALTLLLVCQLIGEVLARAVGAPLPGPVIGMLLLFTAFAWRGGVPASIQRAARGLLEHLSLLFVPAGVGILVHVSLVAEEWLPIAVALVASTLLTIAVTGLVARALIRLGERAPGRGGDA